MSRALLILVLILAAFCPEHACAQQDSSTTDQAAALREKAFTVLGSAADQLSTLQSPENRARLGANIADSLWTHDEKRARALFALVQDDINAGLSNRDLQDPGDVHTIKVFLKLRVDTVERIAKYDAELALAFLKATEFTSEKPLPPNMTESERGLELRLAKLMADSNPDLAVKLVRQSLAKGLSADVSPLLRQLNRKHKEQALILYKEAVNKLRDVDLANNWSARYFAQNLVQTFKPPTLNDPTFRELIGILITRALEHGCASKVSPEDDFCRWVAVIMPQLQKIDPRAVQLKRWIHPGEELADSVDPETVHEFSELLEAGSASDLLAFARKHPELGDDIHWQVIMKATESGDFEQARKVAANYVNDPERRRDLLDEIERREKWYSVNEKDLAELLSKINEFPKATDRVPRLLSYANRYSGNRTAALKLLKQASDLIDTMKPGREQTEAQARLAIVYCAVKSERGFAIMESLLPKLNELVDAAVKLDGYETGYVRDGEWNMSANGSVGAMLTNLSQNAGHFAWCDFDRAVSMAAQFDRAEIRLMAQVKLAQAILSGPPKRTDRD